MWNTRRQRGRFDTALFGLLIALFGMMTLPAWSKAQPRCLLCGQAQYNVAEPGDMPDWRWFHAFEFATELACARDPHDMCRICGNSGGSICSESPIQAGKCPAGAGCTPAQMALSGNDAQVTELVSAQLMVLHDKEFGATKLPQCDLQVWEQGSWMNASDLTVQFNSFTSLRAPF